MFQRHHRGYISKRATFNISFTYRLRLGMDVSLKHPFSILLSGGRGIGKTKIYKGVIKKKTHRSPTIMHCLLLCKAITRFRDRDLSHVNYFFHKNQCPLSLNSDYVVIFKNP